MKKLAAFRAVFFLPVIMLCSSCTGNSFADKLTALFFPTAEKRFEVQAPGLVEDEDFNEEKKYDNEAAKGDPITQNPPAEIPGIDELEYFLTHQPVQTPSENPIPETIVPPIPELNPQPEAPLVPETPSAAVFVTKPLAYTITTASPRDILNMPQSSWNTLYYDVYKWDDFPQILLFDTADYTVQDRMLKRLAFFTEKKGYRGRLALDAEIADQHGWNAHDYNEESLSAFFELARVQRFPLLPEERGLEAMLVGSGIIVQSALGYTPGKGAIVSISRESPDYLRRQFMIHECYHGIYFVDADFRAFSKMRWDKLDRASKRFITSFFDFQKYDIADEYLIVNEFMAHILQQNVGAAAAYFGKTLPERIYETEWRRAALPEKDALTDSYPALAESFTKEAEAFNEYVNNRWGYAAGRVWK
jgi:hypothetical protein